MSRGGRAGLARRAHGARGGTSAAAAALLAAARRAGGTRSRRPARRWRSQVPSAFGVLLARGLRAGSAGPPGRWAPRAQRDSWARVDQHGRVIGRPGRLPAERGLYRQRSVTLTWHDAFGFWRARRVEATDREVRVPPVADPALVRLRLVAGRGAPSTATRSPTPPACAPSAATASARSRGDRPPITASSCRSRPRGTGAPGARGGRHARGPGRRRAGGHGRGAAAGPAARSRRAASPTGWRAGALPCSRSASSPRSWPTTRPRAGADARRASSAGIAGWRRRAQARAASVTCDARGPLATALSRGPPGRALVVVEARPASPPRRPTRDGRRPRRTRRPPPLRRRRGHDASLRAARACMLLRWRCSRWSPSRHDSRRRVGRCRRRRCLRRRGSGLRTARCSRDGARPVTRAIAAGGAHVAALRGGRARRLLAL